mgnify:CR=1 FL=1
MIYLKSPSEIAKMRASGRVVARALRCMSEAIVPGRTTPKELDALAAKIIEEAGGVPSFLNYRGYPASTCISVNDVVVHGIPDDKPLQEGDIVGLDLGVCIDGWHADGAWTFPVGTIDPEEALQIINKTTHGLGLNLKK